MDVETSNNFETRRAKRCYNVDNYKFKEFRILKSGDSNFRCTNKNCSASVIVNILIKIIKLTKTHNHEEFNNP